MCRNNDSQNHGGFLLFFKKNLFVWFESAASFGSFHVSKFYICTLIFFFFQICFPCSYKHYKFGLNLKLTVKKCRSWKLNIKYKHLSCSEGWADEVPFSRLLTKPRCCRVNYTDSILPSFLQKYACKHCREVA